MPTPVRSRPQRPRIAHDVRRVAFDFEDQPAALMRESVQELEELGWRAFWIPELLGREAFSHAGYLLSCTERMTVINGIAQIWSRGAFWAQGASVLLADACPGRYVLGLGFGGSERRGTTPVAAMTAYLGGSDRFVDDFVFWGDLDTIVRKPLAHVEVGADHVGIQVSGIKPGQTAMPYWRILAEALISKYS